MPRYIGTSPYSDAGEAGQSIAKVFASKLLELPMLRYQLMEQQRKDQNEAGYRQRQEQLERDKLAEEKRYHDLIDKERGASETGKDTRQQKGLDSKGKLQKQSEDFRKTLDEVTNKNRSEIETNREKSAMERQTSEDTARQNRDTANNTARSSRPSFGTDAKGNPIMRSASGYSELPDLTPKPQTVQTGPNALQRGWSDVKDFFGGSGAAPAQPPLLTPAPVQIPGRTVEPQIGPPQQPLLNAPQTSMPAQQSVSTGAAPMLRVRHPNGQTGTLPADYVRTNGLPSGFTIIQ